MLYIVNLIKWSLIEFLLLNCIRDLGFFLTYTWGNISSEEFEIILLTQKYEVFRMDNDQLQVQEMRNVIMGVCKWILKATCLKIFGKILYKILGSKCKSRKQFPRAFPWISKCFSKVGNTLNAFIQWFL